MCERENGLPSARRVEEGGKGSGLCIGSFSLLTSPLALLSSSLSPFFSLSFLLSSFLSWDLPSPQGAYLKIHRESTQEEKVCVRGVVEKTTFNFHLVTVPGARLGQVLCICQFLLDSSALLVVFVE